MTLADLFAQHDAEDAARQAALTKAIDDLTAATARANTAETEANSLRTERATLLARISELEAVPAPQPTRTLFGACPMKPGGESLAAARTVVAKWGAGAAVRQFKTNLSSPSVAPEFGIVHTSFKPTVAGLIRGDYDAQIKAVAMATPAGHVLEVWHEVDKKVRDGVGTFADLVAAKNRFYDVVKSVRQDVLVANTLTGWEASPTNATTKGNIDKWGAIKADVLGIDCDGIEPTALPYTDYSDEVEAAVRFVAKFDTYTSWAVPEFGCPRIPTDLAGVARAVWLKDYAARFAAKGALYVALYEYDSTLGYALTTTAELDAWHSFI